MISDFMIVLALVYALHVVSILHGVEFCMCFTWDTMSEAVYSNKQLLNEAWKKEIQD